MKSWLYQMSGRVWPEENYRTEIWEGTPVFWPVQRVTGAGRPAPGDRLFCWYAETVSKSPGMCGWGVVLTYQESIHRISWRPVYPSDVLKMLPAFDDDLAGLIRSVRRFPRGTLWPVPDAEARSLADRVLAVVR